MRALVLNQLNEKPILLDMPVPVVTSASVLVKIESCALNFADLLMIDGKYQDIPETPFVMGLEAAGVVHAVGDDVTSVKKGDHVVVIAGYGGLAEFGVFPENRIVKIPKSVSFNDAAALPIAYGTSHMALFEKANLHPTETLLVLGASGGVGLTAVELGHSCGARVIAVARGAAKCEIAKMAGADFVFDSEDPKLHEKIKALGGVDVVYDPVGGSLFTTAMRCCNPDARILTIGFASGDIPQIPANIIMVKNLSVIGFYWGGVLKYAPERVMKSLSDLFTLVEQGALRPPTHHVIGLSNVLYGLELIRERKSTGKVIITMDKSV